MMQRKSYTLILHKKALIVTKEGLSLVQHSTLGRILVSKEEKNNLSILIWKVKNNKAKTSSN